MTILKFALKKNFRNPLSVIMGFILPTALLLIPGLWNQEGSRGYYYIAFAILLSSFPLTKGLLNDRKERTIVRIMSTPTTMFEYLSQNLMACMIPLTLQIIFIALFGLIRYDWTIQFTLLLGLAYTLFAATAIGFAFAWYCCFKNTEVGGAVLSVVMIFASTFGIIIPVDAMQGFMRIIARLFPTYWISTGIEALFIDSGFSLEFLMPMGVLVLFTSIFLIYGSKRGTH